MYINRKFSKKWKKQTNKQTKKKKKKKNIYYKKLKRLRLLNKFCETFAGRKKRSGVDCHCRLIFTCLTTRVRATCVDKIELKYDRSHVNVVINFYVYIRPFIHCLYFTWALQIYLCTHVKNTRLWKSTLTNDDRLLCSIITHSHRPMHFAQTNELGYASNYIC